ncbi:MAG: ABC transporter permease [Helicobacteraceae bacterium]|jgi:putative ABC transport system permease protein|nr:ABC transporter permease [Helicobacteraceae bacterium]
MANRATAGRRRFYPSNIGLFLSALIGAFIRRRSRVSAALTAVALGATAFYGLLAIYYDMPRRLAEVFRAYGANILLTGEQGVSKEDIAQAKALIGDALVGIAPYQYKSAQLNGKSVTTARTDLSQASAVNPYWQINGDLSIGENEAVVGVDLADMLKLEIGSIALLDNQKDITIRAIVKTGGGADGFLFMNIGENYVADFAEVSVSLSGEELENLRGKLASKLPHITPKPIKRVANSENAVLTKLKTLMTLVTIAAIALTMICVSSTMAATVAERQKEIGLKKALGAQNRDIVTEFLSEAVTLGLFGGALGCAFGFAFANFASFSVFDASVSFDFGLAIVSIVVSVIFTAIAAIFPVYSATSVDPIAVLRGE